MPRTIWVKETGKDDKKSERELRDDAEESHWSHLLKRFGWEQLAIMRSQLEQWQEGKSAYAFYLSVIHGDKIVELSDIPDDAIRSFCFKDCAVYNTATASATFTWRCDFFARIYRRWFPSRAEDTDISHGNFFCSLVKCLKPESDPMPAFIVRLVGFHRAFCDQINKKTPGLPPAHPLWISSIPSTHHLESPPADYHLRPTFEKCFMIVDAANHRFGHPSRDTIVEDPGAYIVWLQPAEIPSLTPGMTEILSASDGAVAYQCDTVDTAVQFILSTDPDRSVRRREWHGHFQKVLDQNETIYGTVCQCTWCS